MSVAGMAAASTWDSINMENCSWPCNLTDPCASMMFQFEFVPLNLRKQVTKQFLKGWAGLFELMHNMLEAKIAATATVMKRLGLRHSNKQTRLNMFPSAIRHYLQNGGRAEYVIDAVLDQFREQNEICGDGQDGFLEDEQLPKDYNALPVCENDFDFKLLRQHLCNDGLMPNGPYYQVNDSSSDLGLQGGFYVNELAPADSSDEEDDDDDDDEKSSGEEDQDDDEVDDKGGLDGLD